LSRRDVCASCWTGSRWSRRQELARASSGRQRSASA
jgi:hypothetical protein